VDEYRGITHRTSGFKCNCVKKKSLIMQFIIIGHVRTSETTTVIPMDIQRVADCTDLIGYEVECIDLK
jgi:hypothetical protein